MADFLARLYAKIGPPDSVTGCRRWLAACSGDGYGRVRIGRGRAGTVAPAHVVVWEVETGQEWPAGLEADHFTCFRHECVEPAHLRATTPQVNRGWRRGGNGYARTHAL